MSDENNGNVRVEPVKRHINWLRILIVGLFIYIAALTVLVLTGNSNLFPTVVLVGNFIVPVSFVAFFYERRRDYAVNMPSTSMAFFYGGVLGTIAAALLEPVFIGALTFTTAFIVGLIEELTKIIGVLLVARRRMLNTEMDGIILGAAAGMGFAALESTGYAFTAFLQSGASLSDTVALTLIRGIAAPVGHGTWTAILAAVLLRESYIGRLNVNYKVVGAYLTVVILHGLWDGLPMVINLIIPVLHSFIWGQLAVGLAGMAILYRRWQDAKSHSSLRFV